MHTASYTIRPLSLTFCSLANMDHSMQHVWHVLRIANHLDVQMHKCLIWTCTSLHQTCMHSSICTQLYSSKDTHESNAFRTPTVTSNSEHLFGLLPNVKSPNGNSDANIHNQNALRQMFVQHTFCIQRQSSLGDRQYFHLPSAYTHPLYFLYGVWDCCQELTYIPLSFIMHTLWSNPPG